MTRATRPDIPGVSPLGRTFGSVGSSTESELCPACGHARRYRVDALRGKTVVECDECDRRREAAERAERNERAAVQLLARKYELAPEEVVRRLGGRRFVPPRHGGCMICGAPRAPRSRSRCVAHAVRHGSPPLPDPACRKCGEPVPRQATGRPRLWHEECAPKHIRSHREYERTNQRSRRRAPAASKEAA